MGEVTRSAHPSPGCRCLHPAAPRVHVFQMTAQTMHGFSPQSSYTIKKVGQESSFYFGCRRATAGNFIPFSPAPFLRFRKKTKSLSTACINKGNVKPLGVGGDNNWIPNHVRLRKGLVKLLYDHYISSMSRMTSRNFLMKACPGSALGSALLACELPGRPSGVGTDRDIQRILLQPTALQSFPRISKASVGLRPKARICPWSSSYKNYRKSLLLLLHPARITVTHNSAKHSPRPNCPQLLIYNPMRKITRWPCGAARRGFGGRRLDNPHSSGDGGGTPLGSRGGLQGP